MSNVGNVTILPPATSTTSTSSTAATSANSQTLTQQDFLQIMVAQFTQQDPLSSGDGDSGGGTSDYVNQLMSMTNLTTLQGMSTQQGLQLAQAMPGDTVTLSANDQTISGVVQATTITSSGINVTVDGNQYPTSDITAINQTAAQAAAAAASTSTASTNNTTPTGS
jgi:flagellar hook assembly protein FlgD